MYSSKDPETVSNTGPARYRPGKDKHGQAQPGANWSATSGRPSAEWGGEDSTPPYGKFAGNLQIMLARKSGKTAKSVPSSQKHKGAHHNHSLEKEASNQEGTEQEN